MKKAIAKEFLWALVSLILAVPIAMLFLASLDIVSSDRLFNDDEKLFITELFLFAYALGFLGIYFIRMVVGAIRVLAKKEEDG